MFPKLPVPPLEISPPFVRPVPPLWGGGGTTKTYHFTVATIHQVFRRYALVGFLHGAEFGAVVDEGPMTVVRSGAPLLRKRYHAHRQHTFVSQCKEDCGVRPAVYKQYHIGELVEATILGHKQADDFVPLPGEHVQLFRMERDHKKG